MSEEFNLSEKIIRPMEDRANTGEWDYNKTEDVKEFIKKVISGWEEKDDEDWKKIKSKDKEFWKGVDLAVEIMIKSFKNKVGDELLEEKK